MGHAHHMQLVPIVRDLSIHSSSGQSVEVTKDLMITKAGVSSSGGCKVTKILVHDDTP